MKIEQIDNTEKMRKQAEDLVHRISYMVEFYHGSLPARLKGISPVVFLSHDIMAVLAYGLPRIVEVQQYPPITKVCGYEAKLAVGEDLLYVGFEI